MKAPDKIYLHGYDFNENPYRVWSECPVKGMRGYEAINVDYIRKDALLEWAKEAHDSGPIKDSADKGEAWSIGYLCGMKDMIDKLNSL